MRQQPEQGPAETRCFETDYLRGESLGGRAILNVFIEGSQEGKLDARSGSSTQRPKQTERNRKYPGHKLMRKSPGTESKSWRKKRGGGWRGGEGWEE